MSVKKDIKEELADLKKQVNTDVDSLKKAFANFKKNSNKNPLPPPLKNPEDNRYDIAKWFIRKYFIFTAGLLLCSLIYNAIIAHSSESSKFIQINVSYIVSFLVGQITTSVGIVIGFYFKNK